MRLLRLTFALLLVAGASGCSFEPFSEPIPIPASYAPQAYAPVYTLPATQPIAVAASPATSTFAQTQAVIDEKTRDEIVAAVQANLSKRFGVDADPQLNDYLILVGSLVTINMPKPDVDYAYLLLKTDQPLSFALWPRTICVSRGLLAQMADESELAGVLAREISNLIASRSLKAAGLPASADAATRPATQAALSGHAALVSRHAAKLADLLVNAGLGTEMEQAADVEGARLAASAKYAPNGYLRLLTRLRPTTPALANSAASTSDAQWDRIKTLHANVEIISRAFPHADVRLPARFEESVKSIKPAAAANH